MARKTKFSFHHRSRELSVELLAWKDAANVEDDFPYVECDPYDGDAIQWRVVIFEKTASFPRWLRVESYPQRIDILTARDDFGDAIHNAKADRVPYASDLE